MKKLLIMGKEGRLEKYTDDRTILKNMKSSMFLWMLLTMRFLKRGGMQSV